MDNTTALAEFLSQHGFYRHSLVRNQIGHLQLVGLLHNTPVDILVDTGAASTVVDLSYCRSKGIPTRDTGKLGGGAGGITLAIYALDGATLSLDGHPLRSDGIYAIDLTHVNEGLVTKGALSCARRARGGRSDLSPSGDRLCDDVLVLTSSKCLSRR